MCSEFFVFIQPRASGVFLEKCDAQTLVAIENGSNEVALTANSGVLKP